MEIFFHLLKIAICLFIRLFSIVIIRIDHKERFMYQVFAAKDSLSGSPRLCPSLEFIFILFRDIIQLLKCIGSLHLLFNALSYNLFEIFLQILSDHKHNFIKPGFKGIIYGIIHDNLSVWPYRLQLLDPTTKTASYSSGHNDQSSFSHSILLLIS